MGCCVLFLMCMLRFVVFRCKHVVVRCCAVWQYGLAWLGVLRRVLSGGVVWCCAVLYFAVLPSSGAGGPSKTLGVHLYFVQPTIFNTCNRILWQFVYSGM